MLVGATSALLSLVPPTYYSCAPAASLRRHALPCATLPSGGDQQKALVNLRNVLNRIEEEARIRAAAALEARQKTLIAGKLGLAHHRGADDDLLYADLQTLLATVETDMTIFYRCLADVPAAETDPTDLDDMALLGPLAEAYYQPDKMSPAYPPAMAAWLRRYIERIQADGTPDPLRKEQMNAVNPKYVLRNYIAQLAIDQAEAGDDTLVNTLLDVLRRPYAEQPAHEEYAAKRPEWARHRPGCSMLSCSS